MELIDKSDLISEIDRQKIGYNVDGKHSIEYDTTRKILNIIDTLEVKDPYEKYIQYASIEDGIKAHAETYSFNIESELFNQLTKEQQALWRKEIEQACISGGEVGIELARDKRYKENLEEKEMDLKKYLDIWRHNHFHGRRDKDASGEYLERISQLELARHFFELGLKAQKGE